MADKFLITNPTEPVLKGLDTTKWGKIFPFSTLWTASSGTQPDRGNGTLNSFWMPIGPDVYDVYIELIGGSLTVWGNAGTWRFSIPYAAGRDCIGSAWVFDASAPASWAAIPVIGSGSTTMIISPSGANNATYNSPMTWATGDILIINARIYTK